MGSISYYWSADSPGIVSVFMASWPANAKPGESAAVYAIATTPPVTATIAPRPGDYAQLGEASGVTITTTIIPTSSSSSSGTPPPYTLPSSNTPTESHGTGQSGLNTGQAAGLAVGCILAGVAIGFLLGFWLFARRRRGNDVRYSPAPADPRVNGKGYATATVEPKFGDGSPSSAVVPHGQPPLNHFLLDATPDKDMSAELGSLNTLVNDHVENYYHLGTANTDPAALSSALVNLGFSNNSLVNVDSIVALSLDPRTRQAALRHVISFVCFSGVDFNTRSRFSMLPPPIAEFLQFIPPVESQPGSAEAVSTALSRWRTISAFLLHPQRTQRMPLVPSNSAVRPQAALLANALNTFLRPFIGSSASAAESQAEHLQDVIVECTKLGYVVFSHPADWRFTQSVPSQPGSRFLVVCAGLDKLSNNNGQPYAAPQQVVAPALVKF